MTTLLYAALLAVLCAAVPTTVWLKRAGDQSWREHQLRLAFKPMSEKWLAWQIEVGARLTPVLQETSRAIARFGAEMTRAMQNNPALARAIRDLKRLDEKGHL